ncbi:MAG: acetate--CoA ligase family protein [Alphaproteobacteria bacterium]|nr:acetate--CoA ligase family protein [Alphaproteobacteria bacterium]
MPDADRPGPDIARETSLAPLLAPRAIAFIGASESGGRAGAAMRNLMALGYQGKMYPVHPRHASVYGHGCHRSIDELPAGIDLAAIGVPAESVLDVLEQAHRRGIPAAVIFASGFGEAGEEGTGRQAELEEFVRRTGMLVCGPNCLGILNFAARSGAYSSVQPTNMKAGRIAVVSQSGSIVVALSRSERGLAFSHLISSGNETGVTSADFLLALADDPAVGAVALFQESVRAPAEFARALARLRERGKPLLLLGTGRSEIGRAASAAHTGALAGSLEVRAALLRRERVLVCGDPDEWLEAMELFRLLPAPRRRGIAMIGISGGENALAADLAEAAGLGFARLGEETRARLRELLPWFARADNPLDATGGVLTNFDIYRRCLEIMAGDAEVGAMVVLQDSPAGFDETIARAMSEMAPRLPVPLVFLNCFAGPPRQGLVSILHEAGIPYLQGLRPGLRALALYMNHDRAARPAASWRPASDPERRARARELLGRAGLVLDEVDSKALLGLHGVPVGPETLALDADAAVAAAGRLGFPVAMKIVSADIAHKAKAGGVMLSIAGEAEVRRAFAALHARVGQAMPAARRRGVLVQPMIDGDIELIVGLKRDADFGMVLLLGLGGVRAEEIGSSVLRLLPAGPVDAREMIDELPTLRRGLAGSASGETIARQIVALLESLASLGAELGEEIEAVEMNPVKIDLRRGSLAVLDGLVEPRREGITANMTGRG